MEQLECSNIVGADVKCTTFLEKVWQFLIKLILATWVTEKWKHVNRKSSFICNGNSLQFSSVQSLSCVQLFAIPWTTVHQASLSITNSQSLSKPMSIESVMLSVLKAKRTSLVAQMVKNLPAMQETGVQFLGQKDPLEKEWLPTPICLPGEDHGQRSLVGYSRWSCKKAGHDWMTNNSSLKLETSTPVFFARLVP